MNKSKGLVVLALVALVGTGMYVKNAGAKEGMSSLTALDYVQIEQLYAHYNHYVDSGKDDGRAYASLFTPDGEFNTNLPSLGTLRGTEELAALARNAGSPPPAVKAAHHAVNIMIDPSPEGATGSAYLLMISSPEPSNGEAPLMTRFAEATSVPRFSRKYEKTLRTISSRIPASSSVLTTFNSNKSWYE